METRVIFKEYNLFVGKPIILSIVDTVIALLNL